MCTSSVLNRNVTVIWTVLQNSSSVHIDRIIDHNKYEENLVSPSGDVFEVNELPLIAVGSGITSKRLPPVNSSNIATVFQFFHTFLATFCQTVDPTGFRFAFYLAYDDVCICIISSRS